MKTLFVHCKDRRQSAACIFNTRRRSHNEIHAGPRSYLTFSHRHRADGIPGKNDVLATQKTIVRLLISAEIVSPDANRVQQAGPASIQPGIQGTDNAGISSVPRAVEQEDTLLC